LKFTYFTNRTNRIILATNLKDREIMEGTILYSNFTTKDGLIKNIAGYRYTFTAHDYRSQSEIRISQNVDFDILDGNKATTIYLQGYFILISGGQNPLK